MEITRVKEYDHKLYSSIYGLPKIGSNQRIWKEILLEQGNDGLLKNAMKIYMEKEELTVVAPTICDMILKDYENINPDIYQELVNLIYISPQIARTKVGGVFQNSNSSFLVQTLKNHTLTLTKEQKEVAVTEALSMPGAIFFSSDQNIKNLKIENHGLTPFDIRYEILMNPNWSLEEKANLIYDFYQKEEEFNKTINAWEEDIINNSSFYSVNGFERMYQDRLYDYSDCELARYYRSREQVKNIREEITMYQLFHQMRPQQVEEEKIYQKK